MWPWLELELWGRVVFCGCLFQRWTAVVFVPFFGHVAPAIQGQGKALELD